MMTQKQAKAIQDKLVEDGYKLSWWYGTDCRKCCGVYPKLMEKQATFDSHAYFECEVCGRKSKAFSMPWLARDDWNSMNFDPIPVQMSLFEEVNDATN